MDNINSVIKLDLHIHSYASTYKDEDIVKNSTKDNINVLLTKLNENQVALFSITDHNRFDADLYKTIISIINDANTPYPFVKAILAGIEFDVKLDDKMAKSHIIAIFDTENKFDKLEHIEFILNKNILKDREDFYSKEKFEDVLREIGLNTILIACQRKDIHNHNGNNSSLSDTVSDVEEIIRVGYIDALEFQKPKVQGILINKLKDLKTPTPLFSGSDCHDWTQYPYHDTKNQNKAFYHTKAKILPSFKGLLMAVTSPESRFNCNENSNQNFFKGIEINSQTVPLVNGVNAIIGENGSGKTTLLKLISGRTKDSYVKKLIKDNNLKVDNTIEGSKIKYVEQGEIIQKFNEGNLFTGGEESNFKEIDNSSFVNAYTNYSKSLYEYIQTNIQKKEAIDKLTNLSIAYNKDLLDKGYYINVCSDTDFSTVYNSHEEPLRQINDVVSNIKKLLKSDYFTDYSTQLSESFTLLNTVKESIEQKYNEKVYESQVKNVIFSCIADYSRRIKANSTSKAREIQNYILKKQSFIESITTAIKLSIKQNKWPSDPAIIRGETKKPKSGFSFNREAQYNGVSMIESFYQTMFVNSYNSVGELKNIQTGEQLTNAIRNCASSNDIVSKWKDNLDKFITASIKYKDFITDGSEKKIGNTLGEMSLSYYKFYTQDNSDWNVLIVDQPEDNISNNNISKKLISYFDEIRDQKQLIFVTHNPLLVVNLDVDNILFVQNDNGKLTTRSGCLEYEDENTNILELIAENMDGGKETIEKRLKVYGEDY